MFNISKCNNIIYLKTFYLFIEFILYYISLE